MKSIFEPVQIAWALIWRSTVFAPVFLVFYILAVATWMCRFVLPVLIFVFAWAQDWFSVVVYGLAWIFSVAIWRWTRFRALLESPPSLL